MKKSEIKNIKRAATLEVGNHEVIFKRFSWRTDKDDEIIGAFIHIEGYQPLYLNYFEDNNYELDNFLEQLGEDSYDEDIINEYTGQVIKVRRYENGNFINTSFNPNSNENKDRKEKFA